MKWASSYKPIRPASTCLLLVANRFHLYLQDATRERRPAGTLAQTPH